MQAPEQPRQRPACQAAAQSPKRSMTPTYSTTALRLWCAGCDAGAWAAKAGGACGNSRHAPEASMPSYRISRNKPSKPSTPPPRPPLTARRRCACVRWVRCRRLRGRRPRVPAAAAAARPGAACQATAQAPTSPQKALTPLVYSTAALRLWCAGCDAGACAAEAEGACGGSGGAPGSGMPGLSTYL